MPLTDKLKGKTILLGREQDKGRLYVTVNVKGTQKTAPIGEPGSVPMSVSRCRPTEGKAHCRIDIDNNGAMSIVNLKDENVTYVNGVPVMKRSLVETDQVRLGQQQYSVDLHEVLTAAQRIVMKYDPPEPSAIDITHLEQVWNDYQTGLEELQRSQRNQGILMRAPMIFSMLGGVLTTLAKTMDWGDGIFKITLVLTIIAVSVMLFGIYKSVKDPTIQKRKDITKRFQREYVCPNPDCGQFFGNLDFEVLSKKKKCPYCGSVINGDVSKK